MTAWRLLVVGIFGVAAVLACAAPTMAQTRFAESTPDACTNGIDDDGDGLVDDDDPECADEICDNGIDDDGDGWIDQRDDECRAFRSAEICDNGRDDDGDGAIDGDDGDCVAELVCDDDLDNDGDGAIDLDDDDCQARLFGLENCYDGLDNDGDGHVDGLDSDCPGMELCNNGVDDDGDGAIDGADTDCIPEDCFNGIDDDGDGAIDGADIECVRFGEICTNGLDDDGDGLTDELDPECPPLGGGGGGGFDGFGDALGTLVIASLTVGSVLEILVPDVWFEFGDDGVAGDLAWVLPISLVRIGEWDWPLLAYVRVLSEVHVETDCGARRGVFTGRVDLLIPTDDEFGFGFVGEAGYTVGEDGDATVVGGGAILTLSGYINLLVQTRVTLVEDTRYAVTMQLEIPVPAHALWQDW